MDELDVTLADVWAAWDAAIDVPPIDEDERHVEVKDIAARYQMSISQARRYADQLVEAGRFERALRRRHKSGQLRPVMLYWPKEDV